MKELRKGCTTTEMDILDFNDSVEEKYGHFSEVGLKVTVKDKSISTIIPVSFLSDYSGMSLGIMWESVGFTNYEDMGLFGLYYTTWDNMRFNKEEKILHIKDINDMELIIEV
ncbi:MAG: hypothetical protein ACTJHC_00235 [Vagococcus sp.]